MIRDIHAVELLAVETTDSRKFLHQLEPRAVGVVTAVLVPVVAALASSYGLSIQTEHWGSEHIDAIISGSLWSIVSVLGLVVSSIVLLELVRGVVHPLYTCQVRAAHLLAALVGFPPAGHSQHYSSTETAKGSAIIRGCR